MKLILVRHGTSEENSNNILQGLLPGKLNKQGQNQSKKLGQKLSTEKIDLIYCSPLNRCQETLKYIQKHINKNTPIITSKLIQERDFGKLNGADRNQIDFKKIDKNTKKNQEDGVESLVHLNRRIKKFLTQIETKHSNQTVLVISHSNPIRMFFVNLFHKSFSQILKEYKIKNASIHTFNIEKNTIKSTHLDDTSFL